MDTLRVRRVQFTGEEESVLADSPTTSRVGSFLVPNEKMRDVRITDLEEEDDDYVGDQNDYLWCAAADECTFICDLPNAQGWYKTSYFVSTCIKVYTYSILIF